MKKPILSIYFANSTRSVWTGFLGDVTPELLEKLQESLFDDEKEEKYLADIFLGTKEDLDNALNCGSHPIHFLQEHCQEVFLGDYIEQKIAS